MGDSRSWFGSLRRFAVPVHGDGEATQFFLVPIDPADRQVKEADQPMTSLGLLHCDGLAGKSAANEDELALPLDLPARPDFADGRCSRIVRLRKPVRHLARRVAIDTRRRLLPERLMGTFLVVVAHEGLEAAGLGNEVALSWSHGLEQCQMKALVPAILLRMARINPLMADAKLGPPHRQCRQSGLPCRGERRTVVGTDHVWKAICAKSTLKHSLSLSVGNAARRREADQITGESVRYRQRLNARTIAQSHPAFVVHAPNVVAVLRHRQLAKPRWPMSPKAASLHFARALQNLPDRR